MTGFLHESAPHGVRQFKEGVTAEIIAADSLDRLRGYVENMAEIALEDRIL